MLAALVLLIALPSDAASDGSEPGGRHARVAAEEASGGTPDEPSRPFGAECRSNPTGSRVVVYCHNPYPETDRLRLHVECARWWDIDSDGAPVDAGPAQTVRLTGRCWKEIRSVWVSHQR